MNSNFKSVKWKVYTKISHDILNLESDWLGERTSWWEFDYSSEAIRSISRIVLYILGQLEEQVPDKIEPQNEILEFDSVKQSIKYSVLAQIRNEIDNQSERVDRIQIYDKVQVAVYNKAPLFVHIAQELREHSICSIEEARKKLYE